MSIQQCLYDDLFPTTYWKLMAETLFLLFLHRRALLEAKKSFCWLLQAYGFSIELGLDYLPSFFSFTTFASWFKYFFTKIWNGSCLLDVVCVLFACSLTRPRLHTMNYFSINDRLMISACEFCRCSLDPSEGLCLFSLASVCVLIPYIGCTQQWCYGSNQWTKTWGTSRHNHAVNAPPSGKN